MTPTTTTTRHETPANVDTDSDSFPVPHATKDPNRRSTSVDTPARTNGGHIHES